VHSVQSNSDLDAIKLCQISIKFLILSEMGEELSALHELKQQIQIVVVLEEGIPDGEMERGEGGRVGGGGESLQCHDL
jgi:hypothetical protein